MRLHKALCSWTAGLSLFGPRRTLLSASDTSLNARNHARVRAASSSRTEEHKSNATQLLRYWRGMLSKVTDEDTADSQTRWKTKDMQDLLHTALRVRHGRVSGVMPEQLLATFMEIYTFAMGPEDRKRLFLLICRDFGVQDDKISKAIQAWQEASTTDLMSLARGTDAMLRSLEQLQQAIEPLYASLFIPFSNQPNGIKFLVDLRADVRAAIKCSPGTAGPLRALDRHLRQSLATWFSVGLLHLQPIRWDASPPSLLEKVMAYEAVHPFQGWDDLKQRLGPMRRVHAFMHPSMPQEPLVILHCALQHGAASSMHQILESGTDKHDDTEAPDQTLGVSDPRDADTAVFYSISSTQKGLAGVDLGNFLIKQVAQAVLAEFPGVQNLVTLSPIPGFRSWLHTQVEAELKNCIQDAKEGSLLTASDLQSLSSCTLAGSLTMPKALHQLLKLAQDANPDPAIIQEWEGPLMKLCAHYLVHVRRRNLAFDPVANFHLRNGASVWRLNWFADCSAHGMQSSLSMMVNYKYVLEDVHTNSQQYLMDRTIPASQSVQDLAQTSGLQ